MKSRIDILKQKQAELEALELEISQEKYKVVNDKLDQLADLLKSGRYFKVGDGTFVDIESVVVNYKTHELRCHGHVSFVMKENFAVRVDDDAFDFSVYQQWDVYTISIYENDISDIESVLPITESDYIKARSLVVDARNMLMKSIS